MKKLLLKKFEEASARRDWAEIERLAKLVLKIAKRHRPKKAKSRKA